MQDTLNIIARTIETQVIIEKRNHSLTETVGKLRGDLTYLKKQYSVIQKELVEIRKTSNDMSPPSKPPKPTVTPASVQRLRKKLGITEVELALLLGVTAVTVSRWENAKNPIRLSNRKKIAELRTVGRREARKRLMGIGGKPQPT